MSKTKKRIGGFVWALTYVAVYVIVSLLVQLSYVVFLKNNHSYMSEGEILDSVLGGSFALGVVSCIVSMWVYMLIGKLRKKSLSVVIENKKTPQIMTVMSMCCAIGARLLVNVYFYIAESIPFLKRSIDASVGTSPDISGVNQVLIALFLTVIIAPVFEEILFRGLVMDELMRIMRPWAAITLQGILFGITHMALFQSIFAGVLGVLLGIIYYNTRSIKISCVFHCIFNLSVILSVTQLSVHTAILLFVLGVLLCGVSLFYIIAGSNK